MYPSVADSARPLALPIPEPSLGKAAYHLERYVALLTSPPRMLNYIRYLKSRKGEVLNYLPIKLDVENVSRCNYRCVMCQVSDWHKMQRADDMSFADFKAMIDSQHGLVEIKIQGMGEPTLAKDTLYKMIRYVRSKHIWVRAITNASLLHINDNFKKLIDADTNEVQISIDGATKQTFEDIRRGGKFEQVVENCTLINTYVAQLGRTSPTKMWVTVQKDNFHELHDLVELAHEMGFNNLVFSLELQDWGQDKWNATNTELSAGHHMTSELAQSLIDDGKKFGLKIAFWKSVSKYSASRVETLCPWPFQRAYVSSDMRIVPCCMIGNPEVSDLGDARILGSEWNGEMYRNFRRAHLEGNLPEICGRCYLDSCGETH